MNKADRPWWIIAIVGALALVWVIPVVGVVVTSIRPLSEAASGWWSLDKVTLTLDAWRTVWAKYPIFAGFLTSLKLTLISTLITVVLTPAAAYAFHYLEFPFRRVILIVIVNAFVLPQQVVILPLFQLWREIGLIDNMWSVIIPYVGMSFAWSIFLVKNFLEDFPRELIEAAKIDGCGPIGTFFHVVLPNSVTPIMAVGILQFLWTWNSLLLPLLFLRTDVPLPVLLSTIASAYEPNANQQAAAAILTMIVPLIVFIVFQRYFIAGARIHGGGKE